TITVYKNNVFWLCFIMYQDVLHLSLPYLTACSPQGSTLPEIKLFVE
ncbi:hypothetical protein B6443_001907, partial [Salmonella enterica]|nr:hypothetical protein [Salmonella enterica]